MAFRERTLAGGAKAASFARTGPQADVLLQEREHSVPIRLMLSIAVLICLLVAPGRSQASANPFPPATQVGAESLALRGSHLFRWFGFEVYWAALYVAPDVTDASVLGADTPRQLSLRYSRRITAAQIRKATQRTLEKNPAADVPALQARFDQLYRLYRDVRKGDGYDIVYTPDTGTEIRFNGELLGTIEGADFAEAFFGIWLSDHPIDGTLRDALRGVKQ